MIRTHLLAVVAGIALGQTSSPVPSPQSFEFAKQVKDAHEYVMAVAEKMPDWDADYVGRFERVEIAIVKEDILTCNQDSDIDDFMLDVAQLRIDTAALVALDEQLQKERVI